MQESNEAIKVILNEAIQCLGVIEFKFFLMEQLSKLQKKDFEETVDVVATQLNVKYSKKDSLDNLVQKIRQWHSARKITVNGNSVTQTVKLGEEYGELCSGIVRKNKDVIMDSIGDMVVVLVAIAELEDLDFNECVQRAHYEIKDRKGTLNEYGNFVKESDITEDMV